MIRRLGSPSGPSTLITSAPQSPSTTAAAGAAMKELMSSTRSPASGPGRVSPDSTMEEVPFLPILAPKGRGGHGAKPQAEFPDRADRRSQVRRVGDLRPPLHEDAQHRPHRL